MQPEYAIIYDQFTNHKKYSNLIAKIDQNLNLFGIKGRRIKLNALNKLKAVAKEQAQRGIKNIILIGNDDTFSQIIDIVIPYNIILGIIPIGKNKLTKIFGIPNGEEACQVISKRIIKQITLNKIKNSFLLQSVKIPTIPSNTTIFCNNSFYIKVNNESQNQIIIEQNLPLAYIKLLIIDKKQEVSSSIIITDVIIKTNNKHTAIIDNCKEIELPIEFDNSKGTLNLIVGKNRKIIEQN